MVSLPAIHKDKKPSKLHKDMNVSDERQLVCLSKMLKQVVFVDGLAGCGKTLFSALLSTFDRVELLNYSTEVENLCILNALNKIEPDAVDAMVKIQLNETLYKTMMSRNLNFRPSDLSSAFRDLNRFRYIQRFFQKGNELVPGRIEKEKPILHFATHHLVGYSEPIFRALGDKAAFIEIVRHPLYMVKQQALNMERNVSKERHFHVYYDQKGYCFPFFAHGWEDVFLKSTPVEKAIYCIQYLLNQIKSTKTTLKQKYNAQILTIPFEPFVIEPWAYMEEIEKVLQTKITSKTKKQMKRQKVPRKMIADGIDLKVYRRCGWVPSQASSEIEEYRARRNYVCENASDDAIKVLDELCAEYEKTWFGEVLLDQYKS